MTQIKVVKNQDKPEPTEVLAEAIVRIGSAMKKLEESGLNEYAISVLLQHETKISMRDIRLILNSMKKLQGWYCRK